MEQIGIEREKGGKGDPDAPFLLLSLSPFPIRLILCNLCHLCSRKEKTRRIDNGSNDYGSRFQAQ